MNEAPSAPEQSGAEKPEIDLPAALLRGTLRVVQRRALAVFMIAAGFSLGLLILTFGAVAAAWDTPYRWAVLLGVAGLYLVIGAAGVALIRQPVDDPDLRDAQVKIDELRQRAQQFVGQFVEEDPDVPEGGFRPRSRTVRWLMSVGSLPIPWTRMIQSVLLWRGIRRRRR